MDLFSYSAQHVFSLPWVLFKIRIPTLRTTNDKNCVNFPILLFLQSWDIQAFKRFQDFSFIIRLRNLLPCDWLRAGQFLVVRSVLRDIIMSNRMRARAIEDLHYSWYLTTLVESTWKQGAMQHVQTEERDAHVARGDWTQPLPRQDYTLRLNINRYIDSAIVGIGEKPCQEVNLNTEHSTEENMDTLLQQNINGIVQRQYFKLACDYTLVPWNTVFRKKLLSISSLSSLRCTCWRS